MTIFTILLLCVSIDALKQWTSENAEFTKLLLNGTDLYVGGKNYIYHLSDRGTRFDLESKRKISSPAKGLRTFEFLKISF